MRAGISQYRTANARHNGAVHDASQMGGADAPSIVTFNAGADRHIGTNLMKTDQAYGWKIIDSALRIMNHYEDALRPYNITLWEYRILVELRDETKLRSSTIAERIGISRGAISRMIQHLLEQSLIFRTDDKDDRRAFWVGITPMGRALADTLESRIKEHKADGQNDRQEYREG